VFPANGPHTQTPANMKTPKKAPRRKSAVGKPPSKSKGTSKSGPRRTNGYGKVDNEKATFAERVLKGPGKCITPGEETEFSEDELGATTTATTVGVEIRDGRGGIRKTEFANKDAATEPVKRKLEGVNDRAVGEPVHGECAYGGVESVARDLVADE